MSRRLALGAIAALLILYFSGLTSFGLVGPDEPRYASIGRAMADSGDWVTPTLWGQPWFEKPALLYWMIGGAFRLGLGEDIAPRLPVALVAAGFLLFFFLRVRREFNPFVGLGAAALLGTSAMWIGYSHAGVTDIPLAATFSAAVLLLLPALEGRPAHLSAAAAMLGLSVLAKGLVPLVLLLPFFWFARKHWRQWLRPAPVWVFAAVTLPWYVICEMRNPRFLEVFFWQHQFGRFASAELRHVQPLWFYIPVLLGALFPSTLLAGFACAPRIYRDRACRFLGALVIFGFLFFSAATNKLPGYLLPLLPFVCVLAACGLDAARRDWPKPLAALLLFSGMLLPVFLLAGGLLPAALAGGLRDAFPVDLTTAGRVGAAVPFAMIAAGAMVFLSRERALGLWFALAFCGWLYVEYAALPWVDRAASARSLWREIPEPKRAHCVGAVRRDWRYGLNYYAIVPLPDCRAGETVNAIVPGTTASARPVIR